MSKHVRPEVKTMMMSRRALIAGSTAAATMAPAKAFANTFPASAKPVYWDWFKYAPEVLRSWDIRETEDVNRVELSPRRTPGANGTVRKMMLIYPRPSSAYDIAITKILGVFEEKLLDVRITVVNFRNNDAAGLALLKQSKSERFDLIMSMGSETTAWLWDNYRGGPLPIITVCSKDPVVLGQSPGYNRGSGSNFAFTSLNMPIDVQMAYVNDLKPKLRNIAVLVDSKNISAMETQAKPVIDYAKSRGIRIFDLSVQNPADARQELERMVRDATAQMTKNDPDLSSSIFWVTGSTSVFREIATINANAGRAAVLSVVPEVVRGGDDSAVLSIGISFESNAHLAAVYAADVIRGRAKVSELKVGVVSPPDIAISFRKLRDIGMTIPLSFFEAASTIYDYDGKAVRVDGISVALASN
jgi:putative tryptophan/tyrosine transport system substrate-binding protein